MKLVEEIKLAEWVLFCLFEFAHKVGACILWKHSNVVAHPVSDFFTKVVVLGQSLFFGQNKVGVLIFQVC